MPTFGRKPCPGCPGMRPPYPPCCCVGVPDYGDSTAVPSVPWPPSLPVMPTPPLGCICPPTSEKTCQSPACPRKPRHKEKTDEWQLEIRLDEMDEVDEVVAQDCLFHLERMDTDRWFISVTFKDGTGHAFWLGRVKNSVVVTMHESRS